jgi:hypothetical protein
MRQFQITTLFLLGALSVKAQVSNDKVANRIRLEPDGLPIHTTTASSTVEWGCLNEALTGACLVYHNDQWYNFQVDEPQSYFLNISNLACRNSNGIQVILIEGNPCETKNYRVIQCIRQIKSSEVFIPLGKVTANVTYLVEIDGFDGDHCDFDIQIARRAYGLPMKFDEIQQSEAAASTVNQRDSLVDISWKVPPGWLEQMDQFRLYRLFDQDIFRLERKIPSSKNALGQPSDSYQLQDTVTIPGTYIYRVLGYPINGQPVLLTQVRVAYVARAKPPPITQTIVIDPHYDQRVDYVVRVYESEQLSIIRAINGTFDPAKPEPVKIDMKESIAGGYRSFMVVLINKATRESMEFYYRVNERGSIIKD